LSLARKRPPTVAWRSLDPRSRRDLGKAVAARHHAIRVRLFGSVARGEDRPDSDIDLLVDFR
jgi:predicted nucleotidyltransferase